MKKKLSKKIIVRMPNWVGDFVMATAIIPDLRRAFPDDSITLMCKEPLVDLIKQDPRIDEIFSFQKVASPLFQRKQQKSIIEKLERGEYDIGILLTNSFSSAWCFWRGKVKRRIGYSMNYRRLLLTDPIEPVHTLEHQIQSYKRLLTPLSIEPSSAIPELFISEEELKIAKKLLIQRGFKEGKKLIGINPGASYGPAKCWPEKKFIQTAEELLKDPDVYLLFLGDATAATKIKNMMIGLNERAINLAGGTSLRELAAALKLCNVFLTNDSGPMHVAAALQVPTVALFGSTSDEKTGPYYGKKTEVIYKKVPCSPCFKRMCDRDFSCMESISVEEVVKSLHRFL